VHDEASASLFDLRRGNRRLRQRRMAGERQPLLRPMQCEASHSSAAVVAGRRHEGSRQRHGSSNDRPVNDIEDDSFLAIHADDVRWLYGLWVQLANESRPLDRQATAKRLAEVLENAEFF
jgi:hypothetical protein